MLLFHLLDEFLLVPLLGLPLVKKLCSFDFEQIWVASFRVRVVRLVVHVGKSFRVLWVLLDFFDDCQCILWRKLGFYKLGNCLLEFFLDFCKQLFVLLRKLGEFELLLFNSLALADFF